jgi:hypothetical protein
LHGKGENGRDFERSMAPDSIPETVPSLARFWTAEIVGTGADMLKTKCGGEETE